MHNQEIPLKILDNTSISDWNAGNFVYTNSTADITYTFITN